MKHATHITHMIASRKKLEEDERRHISGRLSAQVSVARAVLNKKYSRQWEKLGVDAVAGNEGLWLLATGAWKIKDYDEFGVFIVATKLSPEHRLSKQGVRIPWSWLRSSNWDFAKFTREYIARSKENRRHAATMRAEHDLKQAQEELRKKQLEIAQLEKLLDRKRELAEAAKAQETRK